MTPTEIIEIFSSILVMIAVPLIAIPRITGFYVMVVAQIGWVLFGILNWQKFFLAQSVFLLLFNFVGIWSWRKKGVG